MTCKQCDDAGGRFAGLNVEASDEANEPIACWCCRGRWQACATCEADATETREMPPVTDAEAVADLSSRGGVW